MVFGMVIGVLLSVLAAVVVLGLVGSALSGQVGAVTGIPDAVGRGLIRMLTVMAIVLIGIAALAAGRGLMIGLGR
jgi:hypothetical protein